MVGPQLAIASAALLPAITSISSRHELTNASAFVLELAGERVHVDAGGGETGQHGLAVAAVGVSVPPSAP
jgi:hypothetical protein